MITFKTLLETVYEPKSGHNASTVAKHTKPLRMKLSQFRDEE